MTLAMIEAAAIDITMPSPPITASQSQAVSSRSRPSTNTCLRHFGQRMHGARQRPQRSAQDIVAIDSRRRGKGDRERRGRANLLEQFLAAFGGQPLGIVDTFRNPLGIEHHGRGDHRARQRTSPGLVAAGHRPDAALDQRALAAKARRRNRDHAFRRAGMFLVGFVPNHAGMVRKRPAPHNEKIGLCPLFTCPAAPLFDLDTENTAVGAPGFRHVLQIPQPEFFNGMN